MKKHFYLVFSLLVAAIFVGTAAAQADTSPARTPDVPFVPTPHPVVEAMLKLGEVKASDHLYDLGSGDGRIVIAAAKNHGTKGVGVDLNPILVEDATRNAKDAGVSDKATFKTGDIFEFDFFDATVVTLYLLPDINLKLRPILWEKLKPGTRIVSHAFMMGGWEPEKTENVNGSRVFLWRVPSKAEQKKITAAESKP